ncbi:inositol monophosphatase family protein [Planococcus shenhongbingii]|uniref:inositol-phosphate phosphatase n=1 Tax=Planococcus shenhongbingii TaxID=3058398 RepID=A0ABT8N8U3_9BACL|nr:MULTISPECIES: inositol monophosphatase family protein [unclassified Planococcus (in: firmicutes)]MDN7244314.1 inositol monophosphatase family protein [Planococcus sp. N017]WKA57482.1 inositol monophosphatase family protein [Planococcus sp. N016]
MELHAMDRYIKSLIKEAGHKIRNSFISDITIETKSDANDLVTNIDKEIEQFFIERIRRDYPGHRIFGEEGFGDAIDDLSGVIWMLDPIDGTMNFVHQKRNFAISLGVYEDGKGKLGYIYDVVNDDLYHAVEGGGAYYNDEKLKSLAATSIEESIVAINASWLAPNKYIDHEAAIGLVRAVRGTRSYGSAALELAFLASGRIDAYVSMRLSPWDIAGGAVIAGEVGAVTTTFTGEPANLLKQDTFIAANPSIHNRMLSDYIRLK